MPKPRVQILVCTNERPADASRPCCAARDGVEVYRRFKDRARALGVRDEILVTRTGCLRHCSRGVTVAVWPQNFWYGNVAAGDVDEILAAAGEGREIERLRMPDGPWE
jgi:(2Fe-2S) ferredoxin